MRTVIAISCIVLLVACKHRKETPVAKAQVKRHTSSRPATHGKGYHVLVEKVGVKPGEVKSNPLYGFICEWYGAPYKYAGCQRTGVDCSCFTNILYDQVYHKNLPRTAGDMLSVCRKIGIEDANEGDLVFFKISGNLISHVGVFLRKGYFVHSSTSSGVMISSVNEPYFQKYLYCAGKLRHS